MRRRDDEGQIRDMILDRKTTKAIREATGASKATISRIRHSIPECQLKSSIRQYEIDKNIPLSPKRPPIHRTSKYPWDEMEVGDSFLVRFGDKKTKRSVQSTVVGAVVYRQKHSEHRYTTRALDEGIRVWRIK